MFRKLRKIILWTLTSIILLIVLAVVLLYIPPIQNWVKDIALREVKKSTGMDISIGYIRLRFPLSLSVDDVRILEANGDTMLTAGEANVKVKFWPLLKGEIDVAGADLSKVYYQMGNADSALWLRARVDEFNLDVANLNFGKGNIDINKAKLNGGDVYLIMKDTVTEEPPDTTASSPLKITAGDIELANLRYRMRMLPTIDSLDAFIPKATLRDGTVDLGSRKINAGLLSVDSVDAAYFTPPPSYTETHPVTEPIAEEETTADSLLWTVRADKISITGKRAVYAVAGSKPAPGLDFDWLEATGIAIEVDSFYNRGGSIRVPLSALKARERCGISLSASGVFSMDSTAMRADGFNISTDYSKLSLTAMMGTGDLMKDPQTPLVLNATATIGTGDLKSAFPALGKMLPGWLTSDLKLRADIEGTSGALNVKELKLEFAPFLNIDMGGKVYNAADFDRMSGQLQLSGSMKQLDRLKSLFLSKGEAEEINLPSIALKGKVNFKPGEIAGDVKATVNDGRIAANAMWRQRIEGYDVSLTLDSLPVGEMMPSLGVGDVTATVTAKGQGFNFLSPKTKLQASVDITAARVLDHDFHDIILDAELENGAFKAELSSNNEEAEFDIEASGTLSKDEMTWKINGDIESLDLMGLGLTDTENSGSVMLTSQGSIDNHSRSIDGWLNVDDLDWNLDSKRLYAERAEANLSATDSLVFATLRSGDMEIRLASLSPIDTLLAKITDLPGVLDTMITRRSVDIPLLQRSIPNIDLDVDLGASNLVQTYLSQEDMGFQNASLCLRNDSLITMDAKVLGLISGSMRIDTLSLGAVQHGQFLAFTGEMNNRPGVMDDFAHVKLTGYLSEDKMTLVLRQKNIKDEQGFFLGINLNIDGDNAILRFVPYTPTIGYKQWTLNSDNFIEYNFINHHIDANLAMESDKSYLKIFTEHQEGSDHQEDVIVQMSQIQLADWLSISPFSPPIKGDAGANLKIHWDAGELTGSGNITLDNLYYGKERVGDFDLGVDVKSMNGALAADVSLKVDDVKVITATGVLNDSTSTKPFDLDFSMISFPLKVVNPFLPKDIAQLSGVLNGEMDISGSLSQPILNGYLDFDSTEVSVKMLGSTLKFSEEKIPVDSSIVYFNNFTITALNENPLRVNGTVDLRQLSNAALDLDLSARNMMVVNSARAKKGEDVYGKAYFNVDADVTGNMRLMRVNATLSVLAGTNVTYILGDAQTALASQSTHDLVKFVNFADSAAVEMADTIAPSMAMILNAALNINQGSTINVDLSTDGKNKVSIIGEGSLDYTMSPVNSGRLTGRFNINGGFARYTPPLMSEKLFNFENGSYVAFNGDMMNPILNIHAVDNLKANVTQSGQDSRLIEFKVGLSVTNTLENMNIAFNLSTDDDITVQNELASMTPEQRATQAMNLLLYNTYTGPGTTANANLTANPLYSFLASQLNSWAAKNIRGVDLSFGIDQYNKTTDGYTGTATSYSYKVSKSLFNDRFTIVVGGNYSTDTNADENFEQNLISDISFEYKLNKAGSMYLKIFRHTGYESILEGEITQTGVGFVIKRKIRSLKDLFRFRFPRRAQHHEENRPDNRQAKESPTIKTDEEKN